MAQPVNLSKVPGSGTPGTSSAFYAQVRLAESLMSIVNLLEEIAADMEPSLAADTDNMAGTSHHAYRSVMYGAWSTIRGILDGGVIPGGLNKTNPYRFHVNCDGVNYGGLKDFALAMRTDVPGQGTARWTATRAVVMSLNGCTVKPTVTNTSMLPEYYTNIPRQLPGTIMVAPRVDYYEPPAIDPTSVTPECPFTAFKILGWSTREYNPVTKNITLNQAEIFHPGERITIPDLPLNKTFNLYLYYDYDLTTAPEWAERHNAALEAAGMA